MDQRVLTFSVLGIAVLALVITGLVFLLPSLGTLGPKVVQGDGPPTVGPKDFSDGIGIYYFNDGKYNFLIWKKKLFAPEAAPVERDIAVAAEQAIRVKKGVRFYSYGLDFSKLGLIPPYAMGFCVARDAKTIEGIFPIRIKPVDSQGQIYELVPPPLIDDLSSGRVKHLFWAINYQYSCNDGWVFKFQ